MNTEWRTQMQQAMNMITDACQQNSDFSNCKLCPFYRQCQILAYNNFNYPDSWNDD